MPRWTPEQVIALDNQQNNRRLHPYTCPNRDDGQHPALHGDNGVLIPTVHGWICQFCDYTQGTARGIPFIAEEKNHEPEAPL